MSLQFGHLEKKKEHNYKFTFTFVYAPTGLVLVVVAAHVSRKTFKFIFAAAKKNITKQILLNKLSNLFSLTQIKLKTAALKRIAFVCVCLCLQNCDRVEEENVN